jgi:hypothetical protein
MQVWRNAAVKPGSREHARRWLSDTQSTTSAMEGSLAVRDFVLSIGSLQIAFCGWLSRADATANHWPALTLVRFRLLGDMSMS